MSLMKKRRITKEGALARQRNGRRSRGPVTVRGLEHSQSANLRHGFYSNAEEAALRALGEDPGDLLKVLESLRQRWNVTDEAEDRMVTCLARSLWRIDRCDRIREGQTLRQAREADAGRELRQHAGIMRVRMTFQVLTTLARSVAREHFVATPAHLKQIESLQKEGEMREMGEIMVALFYELREPGTPGMGEPGHGEDREEQQRRVLERIKQIFGVTDDHNPHYQKPPSTEPMLGQFAGGVDIKVQEKPEKEEAEVKRPSEPYPDITPAQWEAREPVRQLLENILTRMAESFETRRQALIKECMAGPTPYERAAEFTLAQQQIVSMQKLEDSSLRQATRLVELLQRMKRVDHAAVKDDAAENAVEARLQLPE